MRLEILEQETWMSTTQELLPTLLKQLSKGLVLDITRLNQFLTVCHKVLTETYQGSPHQLSDLPPPLIRVQRTHRVNQAPQVLVWGINWEDRLCNKKTKQLKQAMDLKGKQDT